MDNFQFNLMIQNLDNGKDLNNLPLETISIYINAINESSLSNARKEHYSTQLHGIFISTPRSAKDIELIADISYNLHMYNKIAYG